VAQVLEQGDDFLAGGEVQVAGRLVGQDDGRGVGQGTGDGHALLLAAGQLLGFVPIAVAQADQGQKFQTLFHGLVLGGAGENHGQGDVFQGGHDLDEIKRLKNIADLAVAQPGQLIGVELGDIHLVDEDLAGARFVEPADHVEQGGFARAGRPHDGQVFAGLDDEIHAAQGRDHLRAHLEGLGHAGHPDDVVRIGHTPPCKTPHRGASPPGPWPVYGEFVSRRGVRGIMPRPPAASSLFLILRPHGLHRPHPGGHDGRVDHADEA